MSSKRQGGGENGVRHTTDANEFFTFYSQLQLSCIYYSNLTMRHMIIGYHNLPVGVINLPSQLKGDSNSANVRAPVSSSQNINILRMLDFDDDSDSGEVMGFRQQRRVNFANPLSTVKFKSPTPMHSTEELNAHTDSTRTGFTSDSGT